MLPAPSQQSDAEESKQQQQKTRRMISSNPPDNVDGVLSCLDFECVWYRHLSRCHRHDLDTRKTFAKACASSFVAHSLDCGGCEAHVRVHVQLAKTYTDVAEAHKVRAKPPGWNTIIMNKKTWFWCAQRMNVVINCCWPSVSFFLFFFSFVIHLELLLLLLLARLAVFAEKKKILNKLPWSRTVLPHRSTHAMHIYIIYSLGIVMCVTVCGSKNIKI